MRRAGGNWWSRAKSVVSGSLLCAVAVLAGCRASSGFPDRNSSQAAELSLPSRYFTQDVIQIYTAKAASERQDYRDEVVEGRIRAIDIQYEMFKQSLTTGRAQFNLGGDLAVITLNSVGSLAGGESTKAVLHAISAGIVGSKAAVDKELFYDQTMPVLVQAMEAGRGEALVRIRTGLAGGTSGRPYSLYQALTDLESYYNAGTLLGASIRLNNESGASNKKNAEQLERIFSVQYNLVDRETRNKIVDWLFAADISLLRENEARKVESRKRVAQALAWLAKNAPDSKFKEDPNQWVEDAPIEKLNAFIKDTMPK